MLIEPQQLKEHQDVALKLLEELDKILLGQHEVHKLLIIGILSKGHILLEGLPGVGKTALVKGLGLLMNLEFKRIQFTPDLLPADILGGNILQQDQHGNRSLVFQPGAIFANIVLADEINRASPKTQSAMLEAMQERAVTLQGTTRPLPDPFFVLASQNPIELEGTYPIPEAQLDRFLFKINVTGVNADVLAQIISQRRRGEPPAPTWAITKDQLDGLFDAMDRIHLSGPVANYIARIVTSAHPDAPNAHESIRNCVRFGPSPRAAIAIAEAARAAALLEGRPTVGFDDVIAVAKQVLNHRIILNYQAKLENITPETIVDRILDTLDPAAIDWDKLHAKPQE